MKKTILSLLPIVLMGMHASTIAETVPYSAFYLGAGGSFNSVDFNSQSIDATGLSDAYNKTTGAYMSSGTAGGPAVNLGIPSQTGFAPVLQAGYFRHFQDSKWLWGAVTLGATYFLDASWFIDASYNISMTPSQTANYSSTFSNTNGNTNINYSGSLIGSSTGKTTTQSINISINKAF